MNKDALIALQGIGNTNDLFGYIGELEANLDEQIKSPTTKNIYHSKDYFCWLLLNSIFIYIYLENICLRNGFLKNSSDKKEVTQMVSYVKKQISARDKLSISYLHLAIDMRHSFVHFGLPNIIRDSEKNKQQLQKMLQNYKFCKKVFMGAQAILKEVPQKTIYF